MLPANRRLTTEFFEKTIAGRSFHSPMLGIKTIFIPPGVSKKSRFAVSASKNLFKTAVSRNNARRRVYSALGSLLSYSVDGFFVIVLVKPPALKLRQPELRSAIGTILEKAGIMKKNEFKVK